MRPGRAPARRASRFRLAAAVLVAVASLDAIVARAADPPAIPAPAGYVNDRAAIMDEASRAKLEAFLDQVEKKTGAQFAVLTVKSTAPLDPSEYKVQVFQQWKIGKKGEDNGLLLLVAMDERDARFETGYGLEGTLPDGLEARIFRDEMAPRFREGDYAGGITAGMVACAARVAAEKGVTLEWNGQELRYSSRRSSGPSERVWLLLALFILFMVMSAASRARRGGWWMMGPGMGGWIMGGRGFGGGGFGGGGFGGFGGGASFGGFGGGGSGGGGGGGHW